MIGSKTGLAVPDAAALAAFVAGTIVIFLVLFNIAGGVSVGDKYRFTAVVPTAVALASNADVVRSRACEIGRVEEISNRGATAVLRSRSTPTRARCAATRACRSAPRRWSARTTSTSTRARSRAPAVPDGGELPIARRGRPPSSTTSCRPSASRAAAPEAAALGTRPGRR